MLTVLGGITEYSKRPGTWKWSSVQTNEAMALVTAWPSLKTASKSQSASEAVPPPPQLNVKRDF